MNDTDAKKVVEAVLFSSRDVLGVRQIATIVGNSNAARIRQLVDDLNGEYEHTSRTFRIARIGDGYQMRTLPLFKTWIQKATPIRPIRLSRPAMESLAIVSFRQPVTRSEVEYVRGVDASSALRTLMEYKLIRILGRDKGPGRALLYCTTRQFLSLFSLKDLDDLPTLEDFDLQPVEQPNAVREAG